MNLKPETFKKIDEAITHYPVKRSAVLPLLHLIQEDAGYISDAAIEWVQGVIPNKFLFLLALIGRLIFEWIQAFSRDWRPTGPILVVAGLLVAGLAWGVVRVGANLGVLVAWVVLTATLMAHDWVADTAAALGGPDLTGSGRPGS